MNIPISILVWALLIAIFLPVFIVDGMSRMFYDGIKEDEPTWLGTYITGACLIAYTAYLMLVLDVLKDVTISWLP